MPAPQILANALRQQVGRRGESLAASHLAARGYVEVERNFRCAEGEVDIIAWDGDVLCFIEVRCRATDDFGHPLETITKAKIRRVIRATQRYLMLYFREGWPQVRFDAVGIVLSDPPDLTLVQEAFEA